jgi:hypothetical protein
MRITTGVLLVVAGAALAGPTAATSSSILTLTLKPAPKAGQHGTIKLIDAGKAFDVVIAVRSALKADQMAHIHSVTCRKYVSLSSVEQMGTLAYGLSDITRGRSKTTVKALLSTYRTGGYSINVHDPATLKPTACTDIPAG